jgi:hypothetical protein
VAVGPKVQNPGRNDGCAAGWHATCRTLRPQRRENAGVYGHPEGPSWSAMSGRRVVNPAIPQSAASGALGGVLGLICPVEVADTQMDHADWRRLGHSWRAAAQAGQILNGHSFIFGAAAL